MSGTSPNLAVAHIVAAQNQKEVTANAAFDALDRAITETFDANVTAGNITLSSAEYRTALQVRAINATTAGRTVTLPQVERITILRNDPANTQPVDFVRGSTTLTLAVGEAAIARTDGTTNGLVAIIRGSGLASPVADFLDLLDTPGAYSGQGSKLVAVKAAEDGLEFVSASAGSGMTVTTVSGATHAPALGDEGSYFRCTDAGGCVVTVPANSTQAFPTGATLIYEQATAGQVEITQAGGVTVNVASTHTKFSATQYAVIQLVKVATDTWTLFGNLEVAP